MPKVTPSAIARSSESSLQFLKLGMPSICWAKAGAARHNTAAAIRVLMVFMHVLPLGFLIDQSKLSRPFPPVNVHSLRSHLAGVSRKVAVLEVALMRTPELI